MKGVICISVITEVLEPDGNYDWTANNSQELEDTGEPPFEDWVIESGKVAAYVAGYAPGT